MKNQIRSSQLFHYHFYKQSLDTCCLTITVNSARATLDKCSVVCACGIRDLLCTHALIQECDPTSRSTTEATLSENGAWQFEEWVTPTGSRGCPLLPLPSSFSNSHLAKATERRERGGEGRKSGKTDRKTEKGKTPVALLMNGGRETSAVDWLSG